MRVYQERKKWSDHQPILHLVEKFEWKPNENNKLMALFLTTMCDVKLWHSNGDIYEEYQKDIHRKKLCKECVRIIQLRIRHQRRSSLKTESERTQ